MKSNFRDPKLRSDIVCHEVFKRVIHTLLHARRQLGIQYLLHHVSKDHETMRVHPTSPRALQWHQACPPITCTTFCEISMWQNKQTYKQTIEPSKK